MNGGRNSLKWWVLEVHAVSGHSTNYLALQAARKNILATKILMEAVQCSCCSVFFYSVDEVQTCAMLHKRPYLSKADSMDNKKKTSTWMLSA